MKTTIDWLAFRSKSDPFKTLEKLRPLFDTAGELLELRTGGKGKDGWTFGAEVRMADITIGRVDYGGDSQRGWSRTNITGEGCGFVADWDAAVRLRDTLDDPEIRRLDIALTTYAGEVSHEMVKQAHGRRAFSSGGRQPEYREIGGSNPRAGRTLYIGSRKGSDKMLRCYEKGYEMLTHVPQSMRNNVTHIDDHPVADIYRVELELKPENKHIPWTAIERRDEVFAGAYPFCAELLPSCAHYKFQGFPDFRPKAELERQLDNLRVAYGKILRAGVEAHGGNQDAELKILRRCMSGTPSTALVDAGVLTVRHA